MILQNLFKNFRRENKDNVALDVDKDGKQLFKEDIIASVKENLEKRRIERAMIEEQWKLNASFLVGNQYCEINPYSKEIQQLVPVYDWLERETFNRIAPLIETRIANLKKVNYSMKVNPRTNELEDWAKAETSTEVLKYAQNVSDFNSKKNIMIAWSELCGNAFWLTWWDKNKGEEYAREDVIEADEEGNITGKHTEVYYEGDIDYGLVSPYEVFPESIFKQGVQEQRSIIVEQVKSVDEIYDLYGIEVKGSNIDTFELTPVTSGGGYGYENTVMTLGHRSVDNSERVITYFERPNRRHPDGRMIIIVGNELVYYGNLPYGQIPIIQVVSREVAGQFYGKSVIEDLIPLQRAYNGVINRIHEYIKRIAIGKPIVEEGSIDIDDFEENGAAPGAPVVYRKGWRPPEYASVPSLPGEIIEERYNLVRDMEYVAGVSQMMVTGNAPSTNMSGTAIQNLRDIDDTRLSLTGDRIRNSVKSLARLWLEIYKQHATTRRVINYTGMNNIGNAIVWSSEDINSYDVEFTTENELLLSEEMQRERFIEALNAGFFTESDGRIPDNIKRKALEMMKIGNYSEILSINQLQTQSAQRENTFFEQGAVPKVSELDDHEIHIDEHTRYALQMKFKVLEMQKPEYAQAFIEHINTHKRVLTEEQAKIMQQTAILQGGMN